MIKAAQQRILEKPHFAKMLEWGKLITVTGFSQVIVQIVGFVCGILVIRLLPTSEYALYILANTMLGTMGVLADGGIVTGVTSLGAKVCSSRENLGSVLSTGLDLRKKFGAVSIILAIPVMIYLFITHHAGWMMSILLVIAIIPTFLSTLSGALFQVAPRLRQDIVPLQRNQIELNLARLLVLGSTLFLFPFAFVAILGASLPQVWANIKLKRISIAYADWAQLPDRIIREKIMVFVKRILPGAIYYCISGQITIWLISIFGSTSSIAHVGALTRLAMVLSVFTMLFHTLIVPRFAKLAERKEILFRNYLKVQLYLMGVSSIAIAIAWLFPAKVLWVLGPQYAGLEKELLLSILGSCLNVIVGINYSLNSSRGWLMHPALGISVGLAGIVGGILLLDISTLRGVLLFNIFTGVIGLFIHPLYGFVKILKASNKLGASKDGAADSANRQDH